MTIKPALLLGLALGFLFLSGCASTTQYKMVKKDLFPVSPNEGMILFYRTSFEGQVFNPEIKLDGKCLGTVKYLNFSSVKLAPGNHIVASEHASDLPISIRAGETKYVRVDSEIEFFKVHSSLNPISAPDAEKEIESLYYGTWNPRDCPKP